MFFSSSWSVSQCTWETKPKLHECSGISETTHQQALTCSYHNVQEACELRAYNIEYSNWGCMFAVAISQTDGFDDNVVHK